jgi:hypothetical protein
MTTCQELTRSNRYGNLAHSLLFLPSRWNPVIGLIEQILTGSSSTLRGRDNLFCQRDRL